MELITIYGDFRLGLIYWFRSLTKSFTGASLARAKKNVFKDAMIATREDVITMINKIVPKRTGQLRDDLLKNVNTWKAEGEQVNMELQSSLPYAYNITGEPAHSGTWYEHDGRPATAYYYNHDGSIYLDDPNAIIDWNIFLTDYIQETYNRYIRIYKDLYIG